MPIFLKKSSLEFLYHFLRTYLSCKYKYFIDKDNIQSYQIKKLKKFSKRILTKSPFYKAQAELLIKNDPQDLKTVLSYFPVQNKDQFLLHFNEINTCRVDFNSAINLAVECEQSRAFNANINGVDLGLSTGTSGKRGVFLVSQKERAMWAGLIFARALHTSLFKKQKIALILRSNNNLYESLGSKRVQFKYFDLLNSTEKIYKDLKDFNPSVIVGPPSCLEFMARYELKLEKECRMKPKQVISAAEVLSDETRLLLEKTWGTNIHQIYQATEGSLAYTCPFGGLHLNEDILVIEKIYIDEEKGIFIPIITDLTRESQPIIRYKLDDILVEDNSPCLCHSPFLKLKRIEGRADDVLFFSGKPVFPDFLTRLVLNSHPSILDFRLEQPDKDHIHVGLKLENELHEGELYEEAHRSVLHALSGFAQLKNLSLPHYVKQNFNAEVRGSKRRRVRNNHASYQY